VEETTPVLVESLRNLSIDVAILSLPLRHKEFEIFPLRTEPIFAALPRDHPRAGAKSLSLKELRGEQFVMLRDGHCFRDISVAACTRAKVNPRIGFESAQFSSLLGMVAAGVGVSLVPKMAVDKSVRCSYVRVSDAQASRTIVAAVLRGRSFNRVQQAFLDHVRNTAN
jgi:LysR family hydrogen peroxide-inducible transcriptional activator